MPRVKQVKAAKDYPNHGIKKGDVHYTWSLMTGPRSSRTFRQIAPPRPSQLTTSEFLGTIGDIGLEFDELAHDDGLPDSLREIAERIRECGQEQQDKYDNMPEGLQQGDTGQLLEERASGCDEWASNIEQAADELAEKLEAIDNKEPHELEEFEGLDPEDEGYEAPSDDEIEAARQGERATAYEEAISEASSGPF